MLLKAVCLNGLIIICNPGPLFHTYFLLSCIKEQQTGADLVLGDKIPDFSVIMNDGTWSDNP